MNGLLLKFCVWSNPLGYVLLFPLSGTYQICPIRCVGETGSGERLVVALNFIKKSRTSSALLHYCVFLARGQWAVHLPRWIKSARRINKPYLSSATEICIWLSANYILVWYMLWTLISLFPLEIPCVFPISLKPGFFYMSPSYIYPLIFFLGSPGVCVVLGIGVAIIDENVIVLCLCSH